MQIKSHGGWAAQASSGSTLGSFFLRTGIYGTFLVVVVAGLCGRSFGYDETFHRVYPLTAGGSFVLENVNGSVHVDGWDRDEVEVSAVKTSTSESRDMQQVKIEVDNSKPGQIAVHTLYPKGEGAEVAVEYHVHVPYRVLLGSIGTVNGSVIVRGVEGGGELRSVNGNVEVSNSSGRFSERTTNGDIRLELHELLEGGPMNLETVNGSVLLGLPADARADLKVLSMNGDVYSELPVPRISGALTPHAFKAKLGNGGGEISVRTVNGGIRLLQSPGV
jgi:Putative adhesin